MRTLKDFNWQKSIQTRRLVIKETWLDKFDRFVIYLIFSAGVIVPALIFFDPSRNKRHDDMWWLAILPSVVCLYIIYRKATEKRLTIIGTQLDTKQNRTVLLRYAKKYGYHIFMDSQNLLVFTERNTDFNDDYRKSRIFLLTDNKILFAIIQDRFKLNLPVITSYFTTLLDIKRFLKVAPNTLEETET
ncbi:MULTISPECIES: hypothetical protein [Olivibacter]|uniref:YcxB-like protein domain-containing protein n=1 Tax=Olivibacter jilunii TaxID=985016 RepID=A0ABW6B222_9SPHI